MKQVLAVVLSWGLLLATSPAGLAQEAPQAAYSAAQIDELVSPIALYPDALVAQILAASTYPDQVVQANTWLQGHSQLNDAQRAEQVNNQSWDPSVKALTQFPSVLSNMASNLSWTSALGDVFYNQQADVMASVQRLRKQAKAAGNLKSTPQQTVTTETQQGAQVIVIQPANPQVVYVPVYNPTVIYGTPYYPPGYSTSALVATSIISFGAGLAIGAAINGGWGWGWNSWNTRWYGGGAVVYNRNVYVSNSNIYRNGGYYGNGPRPTPYGNGNYNRNGNNYNRNGNNNINRGGNTINTGGGNTVNIGSGNRNNVNNGNINNGNRGNNNVGNANRPNGGGNANGGNANRPNGGGNANRPNGGGNANRPNAGGSANRPAQQPAGDRGYGQRPSTGNTAFGSASAGGAARAQSNRGQQSLGGGSGASRGSSRSGGGGGGRR